MLENLDQYQFNHILLDLTLFTILIPALYYDLRRNVIPNYLTVSGICFGVIMSFLLGEPEQVKGHLFGLVLGFGFFYILYLFGWVGGGDVKLMGAIGALKGVSFVVNTIIYTSIFGGVIAILFLLVSFFKREDLKSLKVPYGTAICLGSFFVLAMEYGILKRTL